MNSYFFIILIATLTSYYRYDFGFSIDHFSILLIALRLLVSRSHIILDRIFVPVIASVFIILLLGLASSLVGDNVYNFSLKTPLSFLIYSLLIAIFISKIKINPELSAQLGTSHNKLLNALPAVISLQAGAVFMQGFAYWIFDVRLDFVSWFSGEESRNDAGYFLGYQLFRPSGLHVEPGTFSAYQTMLMLMFICLGGRKQWCLILGMLSVALSMSAQGVLYIFFILLFNRNLDVRSLSKKIGILIVFVVLFVLVLLMINERFLGLDHADPSALHRMQAIEDFKKIPLFGAGFTEAPLLGASSSLFLYLYSFVGVFGIVVLLLALWQVRNDFLILISLILLFGTKIVPTGIFFYLFLYILFKARQNRITKIAGYEVTRRRIRRGVWVA